MTITMPGVRPLVPHFSSGPCAKRPGWSLEALNDALSAARTAPSSASAKLKRRSTSPARCSQSRPSYRVAIVPASDTGAVEMALWSLLGARPVDVLAWEVFGEGWVDRRRRRS